MVYRQARGALFRLLKKIDWTENKNEGADFISSYIYKEKEGESNKIPSGGTRHSGGLGKRDSPQGLSANEQIHTWDSEGIQSL